RPAARRSGDPATPSVPAGATGGNARAGAQVCLLSHQMSTRGDVLALVDGAPGRLRTLQGALTTWTHRDRADAARGELVERVGESAGDPADLATVVTLPAAGGGGHDSD